VSAKKSCGYEAFHFSTLRPQGEILPDLRDAIINSIRHCEL
jgi:hypothetical protein